MLCVFSISVREFFADADELDRRARHPVDRQGRTAARVAVHLREDDARDAEALVEDLGDRGRFLTRHRVRDEEDLARLRLGLDALELRHEIVVDLQAARRVDDDGRNAETLGFGDAVLGDRDRIVGRLAVDRQIDLLAERLQLRDRGRPVDVGGDEQRPPSLLFEPKRELARMGRLAGTLPADEHDRRRGRVAEEQSRLRAAHERHQFVVDDFDDGLRRRERGQHVGADRLFLDGVDELFGDGEVDVGFE